MADFFRRPAGKALSNLLCALGFGWWMTFSGLLLREQTLRGAWALVLARPAAVRLTIVFFALLALGIGGLCKRLSRGMAAVFTVGILLLLVNYYKELITAVPLELSDLQLIGQAADIAGLNAQSLTFTALPFWAVVLPLSWVVLVRLLSPAYLDLEAHWMRCGAGESIFFFLLLFLCFPNALIYKPLGVPLTLGLPQTYANNAAGVPLGLWRSLVFQDTTVTDYSKKVMEEKIRPYVGDLIAAQTDPVTAETPNVIFILSESFFDVTSLPGVTFAEDPLSEFHALQAQSVSGTFYTRSLGYGTCNIELEILTGLNTRQLSYGSDLTSFRPEELAVFPTVPALFRDAGYYTSFLHLYHDNIYRRGELFSQLGFEDMFFIQDLAELDPYSSQPDWWSYLEGRHSAYDYYGDAYLSDLLIDQYEAHKDDGPVFLYGVSMENHAPFTADKYASYDYPFTTELPLSPQGEDTLNAYVQGVSNSSKALKTLTDYFSQVDEPTILVFYGDHRPGLGLDTGSVYTELGMYEGNISEADIEALSTLYTTDYLIWANDPSLLRSPPGTEAPSSSNYLGLELLKTAGIALPRYWKLLDVLQNNSLIYTWSYFVDRTEAPSLTAPDTLRDTLFKTMAYVLYDGLHEQYLTDWLRDTG